MSNPPPVPDPLTKMAEGLRVLRVDADTFIPDAEQYFPVIDIAIRIADIIGPFARGFRQWVRIVAKVEI